MQSTRFIVVADLHLNIYSKWSKPCKDINTRFHHQRIVLHKIFELACEYHAGIIFDGDFFDQRKNPDCRVVNMAVQEIIKGASSIPDQDIFFLAGNHEQCDNSCRPSNSLGVFKYMPSNNIFVVDRPYVDFQADTGATVCFIPYSEDKQWLQSYLDKWSKNKELAQSPTLLCAHIGVAGSKMGSHLVRLSGEFSLKDLHPDFFDLICLGHYHLRQYLTKDHHVLYVGSTIPFEHADDNQVKGVSLVDIPKKTEKFIPINSPMFFTFDLDKIDKKVKDISKQRKSIIHLGVHNFVRAVSSDKSKLDYYANRGIDTLYKPQHRYKKRLNISPTSTAKQVVSKYCDKYAPKVKKTALKELEKAYKDA